MSSPSPRKLPTRIIAIDYGMARLGIAFSDEQKIIATPLMTLQAEKKSEQTVSKLVKTLEDHTKKLGYAIEEIIVGLPLLMSGKKGLLADEVEHFILLLQQQINVPIISWDERLTSVQAERSMLESSLTRKRRAKLVDTVAATIILQSYLNSKSLTGG